MPSLEELNSEKESLLKQKGLRDERFEEELKQAIAENKDRYNPNTGTINALSDSEIQKMRDDHNEKMQKEFGEKIEDIDKQINDINTLQEEIKKSNEEMEAIKVKIAEKDNEMQKAEDEAKELEAEYNKAVTAAFHGENATGVIDPAVSENFNNKKAELTGKMDELTKERESLLRDLNKYEINTKTMERDLDTRLNDIPDVKENTKNVENKEEAKPGTYKEDGTYVMTEEEEKSWKESLDDEDSIDSLLEGSTYGNDTDDRVALDKAIKELYGNKAPKTVQQEMHSDILIKNGKIFMAFGHGIKDFKMIMDDKDNENTSIDEIMQNFCEGENKVFEVQELAALLSNSGNNAIDVNSKKDIFKNARDLGELDKNIIASIINYFKGEAIPERIQEIKPEMKEVIRNYLKTIREQEKAMSINVDIKDKKEWGTTNKALANLNMVKDWAYMNRKKNGIDVEASVFTKIEWKWKKFVKDVRGYDETLPPVREDESKEPKTEEPKVKDENDSIDMEEADKAVEKIVKDTEKDVETEPVLEVKPIEQLEPERVPEAEPEVEPTPEPEPEPEKGTTERFNWLIKNKQEEKQQKGEEKMIKDEAYYDRILKEADEAAKRQIEERNKQNQEKINRIRENYNNRDNNNEEPKPTIGKTDSETIARWRKNIQDNDIDME